MCSLDVYSERAFEYYNLLPIVIVYLYHIRVSPRTVGRKIMFWATILAGVVIFVCQNYLNHENDYK